MLSRPFQRNTIDEIEQVFRNSKENRHTLVNIRYELKIRESRHAKLLLKDVEAAIQQDEIPIEDNTEEGVAENRFLSEESPQARAAQVKLKELRQRLLDLSNRNKLINFKHASKGGRQIRVVGEWLPKLYSVIEGDKAVELVPLPPLPDTPEDEQKPEFVAALEESLLTDKTYLKAIEKLEDEPDDKAEFTIAKAERALRDRLRKKLGWPTRTEVFTMSVAEHAKKMGIDPSYDLTSEYPRRGRRRIHQWQTLIGEEELERRMRALENQARESREEYGVETLYLIVGFLEWFEKTSSGEVEAPNLSPLLLMPLGINKREPENLSRKAGDRFLIEDGEIKSNRHRDTYVIQAGADEVTVNLCLCERLKQDFDLTLPAWNDELGVEGFLAQVEQAIAERPRWKLRSYATISHLTFNRLAMWLDLDPEKPSIKPPHVHPVLGELFGGSTEASQESNEEHTEDEEAGVPSLILDCDSSQFAAIKAALSGRNQTIQGPPGTGKSQTIANLIASLLHEGKTVLFVAEKMAALDVVQSRLSDAGIGDFLLELHSAKAAKKAVLESIRRRLNRRRRGNDDHSHRITKQRKYLRDKLNAYATAINSTFGASGFTVHDIIWQNHEYRNKPIPDSLAGYRLQEVAAWDKDAFDTRASALEHRVELENRYRAERTGDEHPWSWVEHPKLHVVECDQIYHHVIDLLTKLDELQTWLEKIELVTLPSTYFALRTLATELAAIGGRPNEITQGLWQLAAQQNAIQTVETVVAAHQQRLESEQTLADIAPTFQRATSTEFQKLDQLTALAAKVIPEVNATVNFQQLIQRKAHNLALLSELDSSIKLMTQLRAILGWSETVAATELFAANIFIELASKAPTAVSSKRHRIGNDGQTEIIRQKLEEMEACEASCSSINSKLKIRIENLDHATLVKHHNELLKGGFLAFFRNSYREAHNFCKNIFPEVPKDKRLTFLADLGDLASLRLKLGKDEAMSAAAGELFVGWETSKPALRACCDWADEVRQQTPIIDPYSTVLRYVLFGVSQDQIGLAKKLAEESWPKLLVSLADQCRRRSVSLHDLRHSLQLEQEAMDQTTELMQALGWVGILSHDRLKAVAVASRKRNDAIAVIEPHQGVLRLLLPDPIASATCIRAINSAQLRVRTLPIQQSWRERLLKNDSFSDWADFQGHVSGIDNRLNAVEQVTSKLIFIARVQQRHRERWERAPIGDWAAMLRAASNAEKKLTTRAQLLASKAEIEALGLTEIVQGFCGSALERFDGIKDLLRAIYLKSSVFLALEQHVCLAEFKHTSPAITRDKFSKLDQELKSLHRQELIEKLMDRRPAAGNNTGLIKERSEMGLLSHVAYLDKPRTSVRDLLRRAGRALQTLKPCFMMSPLSVAQLIERGRLNFDVVIFDEASQVRPEDAMSAMARANQFVVVGDQMQLPPTSFGEKSFNDEPLDSEDGDEVEESAAVESILQLASASYGNGRTLLWHYRSRDPSLIAFSNKEFYRNELLLFPCPLAKSNYTGVKYVWVGGHYSARTNIAEAKACALAAVEMMRRSPDRSLGIVALNRPQADLIQLELDRLLHEQEEAALYKAKWASGLEPLFVKNLENVQGDERDVIFVSTVFGDDESGRFYQRFGPINSNVGHRRLNVLFSRAKFQLVVFSSLPTEKIVLKENGTWGVRALKQYLDYARTGQLEQGTVTGKSEDSPFEISVRAALESAGYQCAPQVGIAGFFIDLGVRHPRSPDRFLAGIECDGAAYHSSRSARDRDRLRQSILESFGWKIYRIWSTDWFADPHGQLEKLVAYLDSLRAVPLRALNNHDFDFAARFGKARTISSDSTAVSDTNNSPEKSSGR